MKDLKQFIKTTIREFLNESSEHIENIFDAGYKVYFKNDLIRYEIVKNYDDAVKLKNEVEKDTNEELDIIDMERFYQDEYNKTIKTNGGLFDINTKWNYTGTIFNKNGFKDKDGNFYKIEIKQIDNGFKVNVFNQKNVKIGFSEFEYDASNNLRNSMYVSVSPSYQNKGIAKAMYDFIVINNFKLKPALSGLLGDGIKLWNSNIKYK